MIGRSDAVVIARATSSHVESEHAINTITSFSVEEVLKGDPSLLGGLEVREPGGIYEKDGRTTVRFIPNTPRFVDGERVLLMLKKVDGGRYAVAELALGFLKFVDDDSGHRVITRPFAEGHSWKVDGTVYVEPRRDADRFVAYIRDVSSGRPSAPDYILEPEAATGAPHVAAMSLRPAPTATYTVTQYTMSLDGLENSPGARWGQFPAVANWNRGNASGASNGGTDAINNAFTQWANASSVNYVLATLNSNLTGVCGPDCGEPGADGVNNIVFEKNLTAIGISQYVCGGGGGTPGSGGTIAVGGISNSSGTNTTNSETFVNITEADVSFNQGVNTCLANGTLADTNFRTAMTHELGHTLGIRHSDQLRINSGNCTSQPAYDCEMTTAVMKAVLPSGLGGVLQQWDQRAITALYPPPAAPGAPTGVSATPAGATSVLVSWTAPAGGTTPAKYHVYRCSGACASYSQVNGESTTGTSFTDTTAQVSTAYLYKVRAVNAANVESIDSNRDIANTTIFTDPTLTVGVSTMRAVHITELRTVVTAFCTLVGNASCSTYTDSTLTATSTTVNAVHITELRSKLDAARSTLGLPALTYTDPTITPGSTTIKRAHITELRTGAVQ